MQCSLLQLICFCSFHALFLSQNLSKVMSLYQLFMELNTTFKHNSCSRITNTRSGSATITIPLCTMTWGSPYLPLGCGRSVFEWGLVALGEGEGGHVGSKLVASLWDRRLLWGELDEDAICAPFKIIKRLHLHGFNFEIMFLICWIFNHGPNLIEW